MLDYIAAGKAAIIGQCVGWIVYISVGVWRCLKIDKQTSPTHSFFVFSPSLGDLKWQQKIFCYETKLLISLEELDGD